MSFNARVKSRDTYHGFTRHSNATLHKMLSSSYRPDRMLCEVDGRCCEMRGRVRKDEWCHDYKNVPPDFNGRCRRITLRRKTVCYTEVEV